MKLIVVAVQFQRWRDAPWEYGVSVGNRLGDPLSVVIDYDTKEVVQPYQVIPRCTDGLAIFTPAE